MSTEKIILFLHRINASAQSFRDAIELFASCFCCEYIDSMVIKTRDKLIEVARQLFANKGLENTTMNDIATASKKGRRTIYTYFRNKREIFNAVIESETEQLLDKLRAIARKPISAEEKLHEYVVCRFLAMKEIVSRNGSLRAGFFRDIRKVDRARKMISQKEIAILRSILSEGVATGIFEISNVDHCAIIITHAIHGLDVPYIRDNLAEQGINKYVVRTIISNMILNGIKKR